MQRIIDAALAEDLGEPARDVTSRALGSDVAASAVLVSRDAGIACGLGLLEPVLEAVARRLGDAGELTGGPAWQVVLEAADGAAIAPGQQLAAIEGPAHLLLAAERTILNLVQRMSGIATLTRRYVGAVEGTGVEVLDTRKTTPGLRVLERHAVRCGGGLNHRAGLYDVAMVKDTHVDALGSITAAIVSVREASPEVPLVVEVRSEDELIRALPFAPAVILLDNMDRDQLSRCAHAIRRQAALTGVRIRSEASGGITLESARDIAETGVDRISVGALTHSAGVLDVAMQVQAARPG